MNPEEQAGPNQLDQTTKPSYLGTTVNAMTRLVFERKFEIDSLLAFLKLANAYFAATNDVTPFDSTFVQAVTEVLKVLGRQQVSPLDSGAQPPYFFLRQTTTPTDTLVKGVGQLWKSTGLLATPFRPSDDATTLPFLVPANCMAVVELRNLSRLLTRIGQSSLATLSSQMASVIDEALHRVAIITRGGKPAFAYEVDGFGNALFMDDGNVPSLLSLPYVGYINATDPIYMATRAAVLNGATNPFFFSGSGAAGNFSGVGSPHTNTGYIWPMAIAVQALTSTDDNEILDCLRMLRDGTAGTLFMHESFSPSDPGQFSRPWFAWANSLFGELILQLAATKPHLIFA